MGEPVRRVSSFGSLLEFRPENAPAGATARCLDCPVRQQCPYDAVRLYQGLADDPAWRDWPLAVLNADPTPARVEQALRDTPYGECVYLGRNDVVDHQVVTLEFASGATADFTTVAFTEMAHRKTRIFGSRGWLEGDGSLIRVHDFVTDTVSTHDTAVGDASAAGGHGGGDEGLVAAFLAAVGQGDQRLVSSDVVTSLESLAVVWAAEQARRTGTVVSLGAP
jgi:predicted dehydrogenase